MSTPESEVDPQGAGTDAQAGAANQLQVQKIYLKDASFEAPNTPQVFATGANEEQPKLELELHSGAAKLGENTYEVIVRATATAKRKETTVFLCEVQTAGVFMASGFTDDQLGPLLGIYCPQLLFPYLRETVASLTSRGGFAPLELQPVNFEQLYARELARQQGPDADGDAADGDSA